MPNVCAAIEMLASRLFQRFIVIFLTLSLEKYRLAHLPVNVFEHTRQTLHRFNLESGLAARSASPMVPHVAGRRRLSHGTETSELSEVCSLMASSI